MKLVYSTSFLKDLDDLISSKSPEEIKFLEEALQTFADAANDGTLFELSEPVDMEKLEKEDPELYQLLMKRLETESLENEPN